MPPNQTLSSKPVLGQKKDKTRITVLLGVNATGTDKLMPWVIGNAKRPRPFSRINLQRLPVHYRANPKAWMNSSIFGEILQHLDKYFRAQDKKILLLVDNAPSHINSQQGNGDTELNLTQFFYLLIPRVIFSHLMQELSRILKPIINETIADPF